MSKEAIALCSEFMKDIRDLLNIPNDESVKDTTHIDNLETLIRMCCDRLETSETSRKELLEALSHINDVLKAANKKPKEIAMNWKEHLANFVEAVIAKSEKEQS